jgi:hypothetical protein
VQPLADAMTRREFKKQLTMFTTLISGGGG